MTTPLPFSQLSFPDLYEQHLVGPSFRLFAERLLQDLELAAADRVLDVACGTGIVARLARQRLGDSARVVGIDVSAPMLAVARRAGPGIDWREGSALALPLREGEQFDVVTCQQGLQFFPDRPAALREMRRALAADGRLAVSTWRPLHESALLQQLHGVAERHLGPIVDQRHALGDAEPLEALLREAGLRDVRSKTVSLTIRFGDGTAFLRLNAMALVGMSAAAKSMSAEQREEAVATIVRDSADVAQRYGDRSQLAFELGTNVVTGRG